MATLNPSCFLLCSSSSSLQWTLWLGCFDWSTFFTLPFLFQLGTYLQQSHLCYLLSRWLWSAVGLALASLHSQPYQKGTSVWTCEECGQWTQHPCAVIRGSREDQLLCPCPSACLGWLILTVVRTDYMDIFCQNTQANSMFSKSVLANDSNFMTEVL